MKKTFLNSAVLVGAAALGLATGLLLRGKVVRDGVEANASKGVLSGGSQPEANPASKRVVTRAQDESPLVTQLARDLSMSSGVTRWLYWMEAMEMAALSDFPGLFSLAENNPAARQMVSQRWIESNPRHVFDTLLKWTEHGRAPDRSLFDLSSSLFGEWSKRDPDALIAVLSGTNRFTMRDSWRQNAAATIIENNPEKGLRLFSEWQIENFGPRMTGMAKWAAADPRHAAEVALANPAGYASQLALEVIGQEWGKTDPARALEFAAGNPGKLSSILADAALKEWSSRNLNEAAAWLAAAESQTRNRLSPSFVEAWAKQDAQSALTWCESNLSGSSLAQAVGGVLRGAAEKDIPTAGALVLSLNPSSARTEAAAAVGKKWFPDRLGEDKPVSPAAITWMTALDPDSARRVIDDVQWRWATCDSKSMAAFLASSSERFSQNPYNLVARELTRKNPLEGIEWASHLPKDRAMAAGADAFSEWRFSQPDAATKWLNELPANDARREPFLEGTFRAMAWDRQAASQLAGLSESDRAIALKVIKGMNLPEDRRATLLGVLKP